MGKEKMRGRILKIVFVLFLVFSWLLSGWPPIWRNPRIPPKIQETQAATAVRSETTGTGNTDASTGDFSVNKPSSLENGDYLVAIIGKDDDMAITGVPADWVTGDAMGTSAGNDIYTGIYYKKITNAGSEPSAYIFTADTYEEVNYWIGALSGVDLNTPEDVDFSGRWVNLQNDSTPTAASVSTFTDGALVLAAWYVDADTNVTVPGSPWSLRCEDVAVANNLSVVSMVKSPAGATGDATMSGLGTGDDSNTGQFPFRPASANNSPTLTVSQPDGVNDTVVAGQSYNITYNLSETEDAATVDFYYDSNSSGLDGTAITGCQDQAEGTGATCSWNTTGMTPGNYYVYGIATDGVNPDVNDYSSGMITINAVAVSVTITTDGIVTYGIMPANTSKSTLPTDLNDMQTVANNGNVNEDFDIKGQDASGGGCTWALASTNGNNQYIHQFCNDTDYNCSSPPTNYTALTTDYQTLDTGIAESGTVDFQLRLTTPDPSSCYGQQSVDITIQAVQQ